ncbi:MAG: histidine kinase, partial [Oscillochloris sp.]|nr:histidine kinase [Oscillochloris sp.]
MRSLSTRLALAFALTSLVGIGLAAFFVRQLVSTQFDSFIVEQRQAEFVDLAASYYAANGSWQGISPQVLFRAYNRHAGGDRDGPVITFALVDSSGRVVLSPNPSERGRPADPAWLAEGTAVTVDGEVVGTVYLTAAPGLSPEELRYL